MIFWCAVILFAFILAAPILMYLGVSLRGTVSAVKETISLDSLRDFSTSDFDNVRHVEPELDVSQREAILAQALETEEGRIALAQSMVEPIRRALDYQGVGRRLFMPDELPQGALARYEQETSAVLNQLANDVGVEIKVEVEIKDEVDFWSPPRVIDWDDEL